MNWTNQDFGIKEENGIISIPLVPNSAQVLDGQHRLAGLERAMKKDPSVEEQEVMVVLSNLLNTKEAASVFLNINTEQRPVPKSLIYDLFGVINENEPELPLVRAKDIALALQMDDKSPYLNSVKMPGSMRGVGIIDLSTIVNAIRPLLEDDGAFKKFRILNLENQVTIVLNYFNAIKTFYMKKEKPLPYRAPGTTRCSVPRKKAAPSFKGNVAYTLNRQFRTWPLTMSWLDDTLYVKCKETKYVIPREVVENGTGFAWESPQTDDVTHQAKGTFCFISRKAFDSLLQDGWFVYDDIIWRRVSQTDKEIVVRADVDRTLMTISLRHPLPMVMEMKGNPLGIDWKLTDNE